MSNDADDRSRRPRNLALTTVFFASFLVMLDLSISAVVLPVIRVNLHAPLNQLQWSFDAYTLCFASLLLAGGFISDRLGHRIGLLVSIVAFTAGSLTCALAPTIGILIAGRAVQGVAAAMLVPGAMAVISHLAGDPAERARLLGIWGGLSGASIAFGPPVGGWLTDAFGWRAVFGVNIPLGILLAVLIAARLPRPPREGGHGIDLPGMFFGVLAVLLLSYAVIEGRSFGWSSPVILGCLIGSAVVALVFLAVERRVAAPMVDLALFGNRSFGAVSVAAFVLGFGLSTSFYFLSLYLQQVRGESPLAAGLGFMPAAVALSLAAAIAGKVMPAVGPRGLLLAGLGTGMLGLIGLSFTGPNTAYLLFAPAVLLVGLGWGLALPTVTAVALGASPPSRAGVASGTVETTLQLGTVVGVAALGTVQATRFISELTDRLSSHLPATELASTVDGVVAGREVMVPGWSSSQVRSVVATALAEGTDLVFLVGGAVTLLTALLTWPGIPRHLGNAEEQQSPAPEQATA